MTESAHSENIASLLTSWAQKHPQQLAVAAPMKFQFFNGKLRYHTLSYRGLAQKMDEYAAGLDSLGVLPGNKIVMMLPPSLEFFALTFALFKQGIIPIFIDPGMGARKLTNCIREMRPDGFIGNMKAHLARVLLRWPMNHNKYLITVERFSPFGALSLENLARMGAQNLPAYIPRTIKGDDPAAILFTSGSTGIPKGALYRHSNFIAQIQALKESFDISPFEIDLCTFPLFALFAPALGMSAVIPKMDFLRPGRVNPRSILEPFNSFPITNLFGSPALLKRVAQNPKLAHLKLHSLKRVVSAGAPVHAEVLTSMSQLIPGHTQIFTPYGATESLPVAIMGSHEILAETAEKTARGAGICVGRAAVHTCIKIISITDKPVTTLSEEILLPPGEIGEIIVSGGQVTLEYASDKKATHLAKILDPSTQSVYHRMGDVGYFDAGGRLWFCGRKSQRVQTAKGDLFTIPCEAVFNRHPEVARSALVGTPFIQGSYQRPMICVELKNRIQYYSPYDRRRITRELKALACNFKHTQWIDTFVFHPDFPVDIRHNAKIFREKIATWSYRKIKRIKP